MTNIVPTTPTNTVTPAKVGSSPTTSISRLTTEADKTDAIINALREEVAKLHNAEANMSEAFHKCIAEWRKALANVTDAKPVLDKMDYVYTVGIAFLPDHVKDPNPVGTSPALGTPLVTPVTADNVHVLDTAEVVVAQEPPDDSLEKDSP